jgi:hypothetical protein
LGGNEVTGFPWISALWPELYLKARIDFAYGFRGDAEVEFKSRAPDPAETDTERSVRS